MPPISPPEPISPFVKIVCGTAWAQKVCKTAEKVMSDKDLYKNCIAIPTEVPKEALQKKKEFSSSIKKLQYEVKELSETSKLEALQIDQEIEKRVGLISGVFQGAGEGELKAPMLKMIKQFTVDIQQLFEKKRKGESEREKEIVQKDQEIQEKQEQLKNFKRFRKGKVQNSDFFLLNILHLSYGASSASDYHLRKDRHHSYRTSSAPSPLGMVAKQIVPGLGDEDFKNNHLFRNCYLTLEIALVIEKIFEDTRTWLSSLSVTRGLKESLDHSKLARTPSISKDVALGRFSLCTDLIPTAIQKIEELVREMKIPEGNNGHPGRRLEELKQEADNEYTLLQDLIKSIGATEGVLLQAALFDKSTKERVSP